MLRNGIFCFGRIMAILTVVGFVLAGSTPTWAASFPEKGKPIHILVGYAAGGGNDVGARILAAGLEKLGISVVVENKPGASGQIAHTLLAEAKPDGYTIGTTTFPTAISNYLDPTRKATYNRQSFEPVALHVIDPGLWAVKTYSPYKNLKDVIEAAKANPNKIRVSTMGPTSEAAIHIRKLQKMTGAEFAMVHFTTGMAQAMPAFLGDKIEMVCMNVGDLLSQYKTGEVRILGIMDHERSPFYPDVQTFEEQGYKYYGASSRGFIAPAGTPREVVDILSETIKEVVAMEDQKKRMADLGLTLRYMDAAQFGKYWAECEAALKEALLDIGEGK